MTDSITGGFVQASGGRIYPQIGEPLTGEQLRQALEQQKTGHRAGGPTSVGSARVRLWDAPAPVDPRTGQPYRAGLIAAPHPSQNGTTKSPGPSSALNADLTHTSSGAIVQITVGSREGGEVRRRVAVSGARPIIGQFGRYPHLRIVSERVTISTAPVFFTWLQEASGGTGGADDLWDAPVFADAGAGVAQHIPEGAVEVFSDTAVNITYRIMAGGSNTVVIPVTVGTRTFVPGAAASFFASAACNLHFRLSPL